MEAGAKGDYHLAGRGAATWFALAQEAAVAAGIDRYRILAATTGEIGRPAPRPAYSVLDCGKAERDHGVRLPEWEEGLVRHVAGRKGKEDSEA